jgi:hypothetical protein
VWCFGSCQTWLEATLEITRNPGIDFHDTANDEKASTFEEIAGARPAPGR